MQLGLVTNAAVYDASPAAFVCHVPNRRDFTAIINRYLELMPDVLFGGGKEQFLPKSREGSRRDDEIDMVAAFEKLGYRFVANKQDLERTKDGKALGLFSARDMSFELDRDKHERTIGLRHDPGRNQNSARAQSQRLFCVYRIGKYRHRRAPFRCRFRDRRLP